MAREPNPYSPSAHEAEPVAEQVRKQATWAAVLGVLSFLCMPVLAPLAVYFGHACMRTIRTHEIGLEHRGAAQVGVIFGWLGNVMLALWVARSV